MHRSSNGPSALQRDLHSGMLFRYLFASWGTVTAASAGREHPYCLTFLMGCFMPPAASKFRKVEVPLLARHRSPGFGPLPQCGSTTPSYRTSVSFPPRAEASILTPLMRLSGDCPTPLISLS